MGVGDVGGVGGGDSVDDCGWCWFCCFECWSLKGCKVRLILPDYPSRLPPERKRRMLSADSIQ